MIINKLREVEMRDVYQGEKIGVTIFQTGSVGLLIRMSHLLLRGLTVRTHI